MPDGEMSQLFFPQVLVPQVEKICIDRGLTDESEILRFLQHGTLVGLLPVPHPILIRKYQPNPGTAMWFRTYMWGVVYLVTLNYYFFARISKEIDCLLPAQHGPPGLVRHRCQALRDTESLIDHQLWKERVVSYGYDLKPTTKLSV